MATCLVPGTLSKFQASNPIHLLIPSEFNCKHSFTVKQNPGSSIIGLRIQTDKRSRNMDVAAYSSKKPDPSPGPNWKVRVFGMIMRIFLPFWKNKLGTLLRLNEKIETTVDTAEDVVNTVEEVAEDVAKVAEGVANHLPKGKLHDDAQSARKLAKEIHSTAHLAQNNLQQVEDVEKEVKSFIESVSQESIEEKDQE